MFVRFTSGMIDSTVGKSFSYLDNSGQAQVFKGASNLMKPLQTIKVVSCMDDTDEGVTNVSESLISIQVQTKREKTERMSFMNTSQNKNYIQDDRRNDYLNLNNKSPKVRPHQNKSFSLWETVSKKIKYRH